MSASDLRSQLEFEFAAPAAIDEDVTGVDADSGRDQFDVKTVNQILDITNLEDPLETHRLFSTRLNNVRERLGTTAQFLTTTTPQAGFRPMFPKRLGDGTVNFVSQQVKEGDDFESHSLVMTFIKPLAA